MSKKEETKKNPKDAAKNAAKNAAKDVAKNNIQKNKIEAQPPLNLGQKSIFELPNIELLSIQKRFLDRSYTILITLLVILTVAIFGLFGYLVVDDQFEFALLQDGTDHVCVK